MPIVPETNSTRNEHDVALLYIDTLNATRMSPNGKRCQCDEYMTGTFVNVLLLSP